MDHSSLEPENSQELPETLQPSYGGSQVLIPPLPEKDLETDGLFAAMKRESDEARVLLDVFQPEDSSAAGKNAWSLFSNNQVQPQINPLASFAPLNVLAPVAQPHSQGGISGHFFDRTYDQFNRETHTSALSYSPVQQYKDHIKFHIKLASKKASRLQLIHSTFQFIILVGAALVSISLGFSQTPSWFPPTMSGIVTLTAALANYYKCGEKGRDLHRSAEEMQQEYNWFKSKRGPYKSSRNITEGFELLQDRIDILKREQFLKNFDLEEK